MGFEEPVKKSKLLDVLGFTWIHLRRVVKMTNSGISFTCVSFAYGNDSYVHHLHMWILFIETEQPPNFYNKWVLNIELNALSWLEGDKVAK